MKKNQPMGNPNLLLIPYPAQGHVIPLMELAIQLAKHGFRITFVNTEDTQTRILKALSAAKEDGGDGIRMVSISDGLDPETRNVPGKLSEAVLRVLPGKLEELLETMNRSETDRIGCVVADQSIGWALEVAQKLGLRRVAFLPAAAANLVLGFSIPKLINDGIIDSDGIPTGNHKLQLSPAMPMMNSGDFVWARFGNKTMQKQIFQLLLRNNAYLKFADWLICNSTHDLEPGAFSYALEIMPIGPLLETDRSGNSAGSFWPQDSNCMQWLHRQPENSVIYVAFGSITVFEQTQFHELALGLELTNKPFLWVVRSSENGEQDYPEGFLERVKNRGKIVGWAPQQKVLSHPSVACFLSHCGWNSTMEGVSNGVPFLCWPYFADQFINRSYISDVWKVGLGFERDEHGIISREEIKEKVDQVLGNNEFKSRALDLKEKTMSSVRGGGRSYKNFMDVIEWMKKA